MKLIFCGTPQFAVPTLEKLLAESFTIQLLVTRPDEPSGRGYKVKPPPVKVVAAQAGLLIFQPLKLKDQTVQLFISSFRPDAIVVVAYGRIIPPWMIDLAPLGCINLHASLLPKYRGAAPIAWALINGERTTGLTTMKIDAGLDTGDILLQRPVEITDDDTTETLSERMAVLGADLMVETLRGLERGQIQPRAQDHSQATLAPMLTKEHGRIDWSLSAQQISWRVRGLRPWPRAFTCFRNKTLYLWRARPVPASSYLPPGTLIADGHRLTGLAAGD